MRRLPAILGWIAAAATFLLLAPVAVALAFLRSPGADGPSLAAQLFLAFITLTVAAGAGFAVAALARLIARLLARRRSP